MDLGGSSDSATHDGVTHRNVFADGFVARQNFADSLDASG